jgi:hypothetical protein
LALRHAHSPCAQVILHPKDSNALGRADILFLLYWQAKRFANRLKPRDLLSNLCF